MTKTTGVETSTPATLSIVIRCFDEERTLKTCIERVLALRAKDLNLEIIVVDDGSSDGSLKIAQELECRHPEIRVLQHDRNQKKGAALRTGFRAASGDFVAVQSEPHGYGKLLQGFPARGDPGH